MTKEALLVSVGARLLRGLFATLRVEVQDASGFTREPPDFPVIVTFWHNRILPVAATFLRYYPPTRAGVTVLTSPSRDGAILAGVVGKLGMGAIRGSTSRRGAVALRECLQLLHGGADLAITPDGPRGPRYHLGPGVLLLAQQSAARVLPVQVEFGAHTALKTWDGFSIPWPFSKVRVFLLPYEKIPLTESEAAFEKERQRLQALLQLNPQTE